MRGYTKAFTREELVEHAKKVQSGHDSIANICVNRTDLAASKRYEADVMATIVAVLEAYPLAKPADECVRIICDDLAERGGFRQAVESMGAVAWKDLRDHLAGKLRSAVVFAEPLTRPTIMPTGVPQSPAGSSDLDFA